MRCAPADLARAEANLEFALAELDEGLHLDEAIRRLAELGVAGAAVLGTIGKPAREAAEAAGLPLLALPKGADVGALERDAARLISERRRAVQHRGQEVLRQLMDLAIAGEPLGDVVQELARISGRPVALEGRDSRLLTYHAVGKSAPSREMIESALQRDRPIVARWLQANGVGEPGWGFLLTTMLTLTTGTVFVMWLGEQITERGIGNGISLLIFAGIIIGLPNGLGQVAGRLRSGVARTPSASSRTRSSPPWPRSAARP